MNFKQIASGSKGNFYIVTAENGKRLLLECGISWPKIGKALDFQTDNIEGVFVTHGHADHSKEIKNVIGRGLDVYASKETIREYGNHHRTYAIQNKTLTRLGGFEVYAFDTNHDCKGSLGFVVREKETGQRLLFATDTSHITQRFPFPFDIIAIECSFDTEVLTRRVKDGDIIQVLAKRLWDSHQEKETAKTYLRDHCDLSRCVELHLLHLSGSNIDKQKTVKEFCDEFLIETITV